MLFSSKVTSSSLRISICSLYPVINNHMVLAFPLHPFLFLSSLEGSEKWSTRNWDAGKVSSIFASVITRMSTYFRTNSYNWSKLFGIELNFEFLNFSITILFAFFILCFLNRKKEFEDALLMDSSENLLFEQFIYLYLSVYLLIPNKLISYLQKMTNVIYQVIRKNDFTTFQKMDTIIPYIIVFAAPLSMKVKPCCSQA